MTPFIEYRFPLELLHDNQEGHCWVYLNFKSGTFFSAEASISISEMLRGLQMVS